MTVVIDQTRMTDGADQVVFRGVFYGTLPEEVACEPPAGTTRKRIEAPLGWPQSAPIFRFVTVHREEPR